MGFRRGFLGAGLVGAAIATACVTDHSALQKKRDSGSAGGAAGKGGSSAGQANVAGSGGGAGGSGGRIDDEPRGDNVLTVLHGAPDAERIAFCFARFDAADHRAIHAGDPLPEGGLGFGRRASIATLSGRDFESDALQPFVIAGDLELIEGLDCEQAVALAEAEEHEPEALGAAGAGGAAGEGGAGDPGGEGGAAGSDSGGAAGMAGAGGAPPEPPPVPPKLRVRGLPVLPAGTLAGGRSYLLVAAGCFGGPAFTHANEQAICGQSYAPDSPTLTPILVALSRKTRFGEVGLQVVHASLATPRFDLRIAPPPDSGDLILNVANDLTFGEVAPPRFGYNNVQLGATQANYRVDVLMDGASKGEFWPTIIARGGGDALENGKTYALIVVGPRADVGAASWWNQAVVTAVPTDPLAASDP